MPTSPRKDAPYRESLARGVRLFNEGAFFDAHEAWEEAWRIEKDESRRRLLQGLIQIAAAFHKLLVMGSPDSAARLLAKGLAKLDACPARVSGLDIGAFREGARACAPAIACGRFDRAAIPSLARG